MQISGRLTALLLSEARADPAGRQKLPKVQAELEALFNLPTALYDLSAVDEPVFLRNCALLGEFSSINYY